MKEFRLKRGDKLLKTIYSFSATEKVVFGALVIIAIVSAITLAWRVNSLFLVSVPGYGGSFSEGMLGLPRSINPVLAFTETDKDLTVLIYSGLMKYRDDELVTDLAKSYTVSPDGLVYDFKLKDDVRFHDGTSLTTDDIEFTIQKIQDGDIKSPKRVDWASVTIRKINATEIQFILKQPYLPFLSNTTIGILPKHIWKNLDTDQFIFSKNNLEPIGSGSYKASSVLKDDVGTPIGISLKAFRNYALGTPFISNIDIHFYQNEEDMLNAFNSGLIENVGGISPEQANKIASSTSGTVIIHNPLSRIFGVFINQNNSPVLANREVRQALDLAVDRNKIIEDVLYDYGIGIQSPIPTFKNGASTSPNLDMAKAILAKAGWVINANGVLEKKIGKGRQTLEFSIATADSVDLKKTAEIIKKNWEDMGAKVTIKVFEYGDLSQNIIKTRKYDALLFGEIVSKDLDLFAFWHSSQRNSPGLNISMYANSKADKILEEVRITYDEKKRADLHKSLDKIIRDDIPAIFLYSPEYIYLMSNSIKGYVSESLTNQSDRFYSIDRWYIDTDKVWKIFMNK